MVSPAAWLRVKFIGRGSREGREYGWGVDASDSLPAGAVGPMVK